MYRLDREDFLKFPLIGLWALLGFQAGFINSFGYLACGRFVSHVTGFGTQIGMAIGANDFLAAIELFGFPLSFILGAFFSGLFTSAKLERGLKPRYDWITLFLPLSILLIAILGWAGVFGTFGERFLEARHLILLFALSFACGVQNGCFATMTKGQIRTTHLTGISTDIGTDLARLYFGKLNPVERSLVVRANLSRIATFLSFGVGSIISVIATQHLHFTALVFPFLASFTVYLVVLKISSEMNIKGLALKAL